MASIESSFLLRSTHGIGEYTDPDLPKLRVTINYMTGMEGDFWKQIRGLGLSYDYSIFNAVEQGRLYFELGMSSELVDAYKAARSVVQGYLTGALAFNEDTLRAAKSSLLFELIDGERNAASCSNQSISNFFRQVDDRTYSKTFIEAVQDVSINDMKYVLGKYISNLFDDEVCVLYTRVLSFAANLCFRFFSSVSSRRLLIQPPLLVTKQRPSPLKMRSLMSLLSSS
jgi:Zn-dependent M16 (insulinase) family peptidase